MTLTYETINLMLLLIPGFVSRIIFNLIRRRSSTAIFDKITESLIFTFLIYLSSNFIQTWTPLAQVSNVNNKLTYELTNDPCFLLSIFGITLILPIILGSIVHYDLHMRLFRKLHITDRTSRDTAWDDVFTDEKRFLTLHLNDEKRITGWPTYYSNNQDQGFIYLTQSAWLDINNEYIDTESNGLLFDKEQIQYIEFMHNPNKDQKEVKNEQE